MKKKDLTELVFIFNKSGSMAGLEADTIGGYNSMLKKQQKAEGEAIVTTVLFNHQYELLHDRINVRGIAPITEEDYEIGGTTALLDSIGVTIKRLLMYKREQVWMNVQKRYYSSLQPMAWKIASSEYTTDTIKKMIQNQKEKYGWEFIFLGANIDAISTAAQFGIDEDFAVDYHADHVGTQLSYDAINEAVLNIRNGK